MIICSIDAMVLLTNNADQVRPGVSHNFLLPSHPLIHSVPLSGMVLALCKKRTQNGTHGPQVPKPFTNCQFTFQC